MNPLKIIIATAFLFFFGSFLSGCSPESSPPDAAIGLRGAAQAMAYQKDAELQVKADRKGSVYTVTVTLENPARKPISSVQSWFSFDPSALLGETIDLSRSPFTLSAPGENSFDQKSGLVKLGRATQTPVTDPFIEVASFTFRSLKKGTTMVHPYDYQPVSGGHLSANVIGEDGLPHNVLKAPQIPLLILQN